MLDGVTVVCLEVTYPEALRRVGGDPLRPGLARPDIREIYERRRPIYREVATVCVSTDARCPGPLPATSWSKCWARDPLAKGGGSTRGVVTPRSTERATVPESTAAVATAAPERYAKQLASHLAHKATVHVEGAGIASSLPTAAAWSVPPPGNSSSMRRRTTPRGSSGFSASLPRTYSASDAIRRAEDRPESARYWHAP